MEVKLADCPLGAKCEEVKTDQDGKQVLYRCPWYIKLRGKDPQSEKEIDEWSCAIAWTPILLIENTQMSRQTGAAVESFRNTVIENRAQQIAKTLQKTLQQNLLIPHKVEKSNGPI